MININRLVLYFVLYFLVLVISQLFTFYIRLYFIVLFCFRLAKYCWHLVSLVSLVHLPMGQRLVLSPSNQEKGDHSCYYCYNNCYNHFPCDCTELLFQAWINLGTLRNVFTESIKFSLNICPCLQLNSLNAKQFSAVA